MAFYALEPITSTSYHIQHYHFQGYQFIYADVGEQFSLSAQWIICAITSYAEACKARGVGVPLAIVVSRYTSRTCPSIAQAFRL
ncbi:hypothetical protein [Thiorhodospira sibirica]|uniref:hypothetical protein n=1 Tax=Thiorhodospira sibirica TaxID=154347 RepID=UPI00022C465D|nr:hypothetical protein [Thiorhodospira sibirica]